jgi:hypothetical protein
LTGKKPHNSKRVETLWSSSVYISKLWFSVSYLHKVNPRNTENSFFQIQEYYGTVYGTL